MTQLAAPPTLGRDPLELFRDAGLERGKDGELRLGDVAAAAIARDVGTPCYVYHAGSIEARYRALTTAFAGVSHRICYAVKSNANLAVLRVLRNLGAGADIVSGGELERIRRAGFDPTTVVFSGVGKSRTELEAAIAMGLGSINIESTDELSAVEAIVASQAMARPVRIGIRVNPDVTAETHPYITTGAGGVKFGIAAPQVPDVAERVSNNPRFRLVGLAMHLGSQLLDPAPLVRGTAKLMELVTSVRQLGIGTLEYVDIGGGLGVRYRDETPIDPAVLAAKLLPLVAGKDVALHLEPGRFLTASAGLLLTKVLYRKRSGGKDFVIVDAAMNDLVRPSHYDAHHAIVEVAAHHRPERVVDVVGPVCETGDFLARDRPLAEVMPGEYLAVLGAGSYGFVMASNYNSRPLPPEVLVDRGRFAVARPRQTLDQMLGGERVDLFQ